MHTEGRGLKEVTVEQEAEVLPSHARDDGGGEIQKDKRGKRGRRWGRHGEHLHVVAQRKNMKEPHNL